MGTGSNLGARRGFVWLLLFAALLMRVAIPQGYMPETDSDGTLTITICHSDAVLNIPLEKKDRKRKGQEPCAFASLAIGAAGPSVGPVLPMPQPVAESFVSTEAPFALRAAARQMPPARGPPVEA